MTPVIPCSVSNIAFVPKSALTTRKNRNITRFNCSGRSALQASSSQRFLLHLPTNIRVFPDCHTLRVHRLSATGTDVAVETQDSPTEPDASASLPGEPSTSSEPKEEPTVESDPSSSSAQSRRSRPRRSDMPPVKNEDLVPGAMFSGKVRSIQPFGAFIDFGAFTDGLVHVSRLSDTFVKDVGDVVSIGQEVKVRLVEVNPEAGRIALSMRESDDKARTSQRADPSRSSDDGSGPRRSSQKRVEVRKASKFVKGQELTGTVKNLTRAGAFVSLPEGEEGFLPSSEQADDEIQNIIGTSSLEIGQEVNVRVLRLARGQVTLTMKKEVDLKKLDAELNQGLTVHSATNPFVLAFRQNKDISAFLDEREKLEEVAQASESSTEPDNPSHEVKTEPESSAKIAEEVSVSPTEVSKDENLVDDSGSSVEQVSAVESSVAEEVQVPTSETAIPDSTSNEDGTASEGVVAEEVATVSNTEEQTPTTDNGALPPSVEDQSVSPVPENVDIGTASTPLSEQSDADLPVVAKVDIGTASTPPSEQSDADLPVVAKVDISTATTPPSEQSDADLPVEATAKATIAPALVKQLRDESGAGMMDCKKALTETGGDIAKASEYLRKKGLASAEKKASRVTAEGRVGSYIHDSRIGVLIEVNCETDFVSRGDIFRELVEDLAMQVAACPQVECLVPEDVPKEIVEKEREIEMQKEDLLSKPEQIRSRIVDGRIKKRLDEMALLEQPYIKDDKVLVKDWVKQTISTIGENIKVRRFVRYNLGEGLEKKSQDFAAEVAAQTAAKPPPVKEQPSAAEAEKAAEGAPSVVVSAALVKQLREETGAGMMDCKKALSETGGDLEKAQEYLRKKGLSTADKKSSRLAAEGRIGTYIHDSRIGVLIEVNCETDFVGRSERFKELVDDLAMQVVACPQVQFVSMDEVPQEVIQKEKEIEMQREDILSKPENIREKIVEGRVTKRLGELVLLEQPFIKDDGVLIKDLVKQTVAALGENIKVRRFTRFTLGEKTETEASEE